MITKFKIFENYNNDLVSKIQSVLTPDLLRGKWKRETDNPLAGHCYAATEALYWMLGGPNSDWKSYIFKHKTFPEGLEEGETHWFLKNIKTGEILDPTAGQFDVEIPYENATQAAFLPTNGGSKRAKEIIKRIENLSESNENKDTYIAGKNAFNIFLQIISNHGFNFINNEHYTSIYDYHLFFSTETIKDNDEFVNIFKFKKSLPSAYNILTKIKTNKLSFFFGIKEDKLLRYGFLDLDTQRSYVIGEFTIFNNGYFRSIVKYKCLRIVNKVIQNLNIKKLYTLSKIKKDLIKFYKDKKNSNIELDDDKVIKYINRDQFTDEELNMNRLYRTLDKWVSKRSWRNNVEYNVDDTVDPIKIIIIVK
jgi:hypothetical protein